MKGKIVVTDIATGKEINIGKKTANLVIKEKMRIYHSPTKTTYIVVDIVVIIKPEKQVNQINVKVIKF